jgi:hypothetical protein
MKNVDDVIENLLECLKFAYKLKFEGDNEEQNLGSLVDDIRDTFIWGIEE